ncbi:MAG TPA: glycoside hydrolase family 38 C-terminal domain-containing protein, partial [bacterium]|nr:glycoside hydrolase family 38 C-terminal domain-containing protein [bacterium]
GHYWGHNYQRVLFLAEQVPASGYRTYIIGESPEAQPCLRQRYDYRLEQPMNFILENDRLLVQLDNSSGAIKRLFLKESNLELVSPEKPLALFRLIEERFPLGAGMTAWLVGSYSRIENLEGVCFSADSLCNGPLRRAITWNAKIRHSRLTVTLSLDRNSADLSLKGHCLWREWGEKDRFVPQLNLQFPLRIKSPVRHYEIPFGWVMRNEEEMDLPALRWADINGLIPGTRQKAGLTVYTEAKHGFRSGEDFLALTLLRSSHDPDPVPEIGEHSFRIILSPYTGPFHPERCFQKAETADFPMTVFQTDAHAGLLPSEGSFLEIAENNVVLASLKKPEDGSGLVLRFYEVAGKKTNLHLKLHRKIFPSGVAVTETDTCEHKKGKTVRFSGPEIRWEIPSRGLLTLLLEPSG